MGGHLGGRRATTTSVARAGLAVRRVEDGLLPVTGIDVPVTRIDVPVPRIDVPVAGIDVPVTEIDVPITGIDLPIDGHRPGEMPHDLARRRVSTMGRCPTALPTTGIRPGARCGASLACRRDPELGSSGAFNRSLANFVGISAARDPVRLEERPRRLSSSSEAAHQGAHPSTAPSNQLRDKSLCHDLFERHVFAPRPLSAAAVALCRSRSTHEPKNKHAPPRGHAVPSLCDAPNVPALPKQFGQRGHLVISTGAALSVAHQLRRWPQHDDAFSIEPCGRLFRREPPLGRRRAVVQLLGDHDDSDDLQTTTSSTESARGSAYDVPITSSFSLWPRATLLRREPQTDGNAGVPDDEHVSRGGRPVRAGAVPPRAAFFRRLRPLPRI